MGLVYLTLLSFILFISKRIKTWSSHCGAGETNPTSIHEDVGSIPGLTQWVKDPALLWLWCKPAAVAPSGLLAWEPACAADVALKRQKEKKEKKIFLMRMKKRKTSISKIICLHIALLPLKDHQAG